MTSSLRRGTATHRRLATGAAALVFLGPAGVGAQPAPEDDVAQALEQAPTDADGDVEVSDLALESLLELEVTAATRTPTKIADSPSTASVITREQIRDFGWLSINDLLYTLPGFARTQSFERRTVGFRGEQEGWNNNRLLLTIDGIAHNGIETGTAFTNEATPLYFAKRVDIVRGPASAMYGSNAVHGVVALETVTADDLGDGGMQARLRGGTRTASIDAVGAQKGRWADAVIGVSGFHSEGDEFLDHDDSYRMGDDGDPARFQVNDERSSSYQWLSVVPTVAPLRGLTLGVHHQSQQAETGHGWGGMVADAKEYVSGSRTTIDLTYRKTIDRVALEETVQVSRERSNASIRYYPAGTFDGYYPQGVTEVYDMYFHGLLARSQARLTLDRGVNLLGGVEYSGLLYRGDREHYSNADFVDPDGSQLDENRGLAAMYEPIQDRPVHRVGVYAQAVSGELLGKRLELTAGARYDNMFYRYIDIGSPDRPERSDARQQVSPRLALIARPTDSLHLKAMAGHSYRTPTLVELFVSNTWTGTSNVGGVEAEEATTVEGAIDWAVADPMRLRATTFYTDHRNMIDYTADAQLINVFSNRRAGVEAEVLGATKLGPLALDGFASYSYVKLLDEDIVDPALSESDMLVWSPSHLVKLGVRGATKTFGFTTTAYAQSKTRRRASDRMDEAFRDLRPHDVAGWVSVDATVFARPSAGVKVGLEGTNLGGSTGGIIQTRDHAFDNRVPARQVMGVLELEL
ncbi:MAG TPA: TonB-dependent receptor [Kofleriaceae bacterium]|nr:TonB-dependent receptor [Kofleriaceae bacterium]